MERPLRKSGGSDRNIRTLVAGAQAAGSQTIVWDGKDDYGRNTTSGMYFYELRTDSIFCESSWFWCADGLPGPGVMLMSTTNL